MELTGRRLAAFATLLAVAALTRELTAVLLWWVFVATYPHEWRWSLIYAAWIAAILMGLRVLIPAEPSRYTIAYTWQLNMESWRLQGAVLYQGLLLPLWLLLYHRTKRGIARRYTLILIPYLILIFTLGVWQEVRLMMPVLILGIPFAKDVFDDK